MDTPAHGCKCSNRGCDEFCNEEITETSRGYKKKWKLDYPEEKVAISLLLISFPLSEQNCIPNHSLRSDSLIFRNMIRHIRITRPNSQYHNRNTLCSARTYYTQPKHRQYRSRNNTKICKIISKRCSNCY